MGKLRNAWTVGIWPKVLQVCSSRVSKKCVDNHYVVILCSHMWEQHIYMYIYNILYNYIINVYYIYTHTYEYPQTWTVKDAT